MHFIISYQTGSRNRSRKEAWNRSLRRSLSGARRWSGSWNDVITIRNSLCIGICVNMNETESGMRTWSNILFEELQQPNGFL